MLNRYQHHFFPPSSTLLSELKPSKLKETENPGKMFYMAFSIYTTMLFLRMEASSEPSAQGTQSTAQSFLHSHFPSLASLTLFFNRAVHYFFVGSA